MYGYIAMKYVRIELCVITTNSHVYPVVECFNGKPLIMCVKYVYLCTTKLKTLDHHILATHQLILFYVCQLIAKYKVFHA